ncbi:hypothetical protein, partial [Flagellimonas beolgyonensis]|uniref:hypothetical protein n=1 Tax=Flagellimonas beolgyonensis TaxID=864064 RepID=UPI003D656B57
AAAGATGVDLDPTFATDTELANAISASEALDNDTDDTNELSDIQLTATTLELTNAAAGATGVDLDPTFATDTELANAISASEALDNDTDDTNELSDLSLTGDLLELTNAAAGASGVDLSAYDEIASVNQVASGTGISGAYTIPDASVTPTSIIQLTVQENTPGNPILIQLVGQGSGTFNVQIYEFIGGIPTANNANWQYIVINP